MLKISLIILLSLFILHITSSNIASDNVITVILDNYEISANQSLIFLFVIFALLFISLTIYLLLKLSFALAHIKIVKQHQKSQISLDLIVKSITATSLGDHKSAANILKKIDKIIPKHPLANLLHIQNATLSNNQKSIKKNFTALLKNKHTKNFALQGIAALAQKNHDYHQASIYLEESYKKQPNAKNIILALLENYQKSQNWEKLIKLLIQNKRKDILDKTSYNQTLALSYLMIYLKNNDHETLLKAKKLDKSHHIIQLEYAKYLTKSERNSAYIRYIKTIWPENPHPLLIKLLMTNIGDKNIKSQLKILKNLVKINPHAIAALDKYIKIATENNLQIDQCKKLLEKSLLISNSVLLYERALKFYENFSDADNDLMREKLISQADNYNFTPYYICNSCNHKSEEWQLECPKCSNANKIIYHGYFLEKMLN